MKFIFRELNAGHAKAYRALRLRSFQEAPFAFSESYEDEQHRSFSSFEKELISKGALLIILCLVFLAKKIN